MYATEPPSVVTALDRRSGQAALDLVARRRAASSCMQQASRKKTTLERPLAGPATVRFKRVAVHADGRIGKYSPSGARGVYRFRLYSKK
jgi:hypothetical protein